MLKMLRFSIFARHYYFISANSYVLIGLIYSVKAEEPKTIILHLLFFVVFGIIWIIYFATLLTNYIKTATELKKF